MTVDEARENLYAALAYLSEEERALIARATEIATRAHARQKRTDGSPYITHPLAVALILTEWKADAETIIAGILHDTLEDTTLSLGKIKEVFGRKVATLVEGVTKFTQADFEGEESMDRKVETLRKLFEVMRRDIRVVIIKLADRLHNARTIDRLPTEKRKRFAQETIDVYYKLTYHLGMNEVRRELAELCIPHITPKEAKKLYAARREAIKKGKKIKQQLEEEIRKHDRKGELISMLIHTRSLYSMQREQKRLGAIRQGYVIIVTAKDRDACYNLLKLFHTLYRPISGEFHDYIAIPTESSYQSIRTAVLGPDNEFVFLRIRTEEMDQQEHMGILRKCFGEKKDVPGFSWLARSQSLDQATRESSEAFWEALQSDIFQESIHVVVDGKDTPLPKRATVLDALYARHAEDAHRTLSVVVNGTPGTLADNLQEDDVLHVELDSKPHVSFDWLGSTETHYARNLIVEALKERNRSEKIALGQRLLQKEFDHYQKGIISSIPKAQRDEVAVHFRRENFDDVFSLIGEGTIHARDIVFHLYPEHKRRTLFQKTKSPWHAFRLHITGTQEKQQNILPRLYALTKVADAEIVKTDLRFHPKTGTFDLFVRGRSSDRLHFGDFLAVLERQNWISNVRTLISYRQKILLANSFGIAFLFILLDILLLPHYQKFLEDILHIPLLFLQALPLLPILIMNYVLLRLLRHYVVRMRTSRWFVGLGCVLNIVGLLLIIPALYSAGIAQQGLFPLVTIFVLSMLLLGYRFFQTEALFTGFEEAKLRPLSTAEWRRLKKRKIIGYTFRICAVTVWGIQPLYLKYTPANDVSPFVRVFLTAVGVLFITMIIMLGKRAVTRKRLQSLRIPKGILLANIMIGQVLFTYFLNASLQFTTSTNFVLFNNFSPVLALLVAAVLWRNSIPYLKSPTHMLWIFIIFLLGSTGSALIIYNDIRFPGIGSVHGDILGILAMAADTLLVVSMIRYMKVYSKASSLAVNLHVFTFQALLTLPPLVYLYITGAPFVRSLTLIPVLFGIGGGVLSGIGKILNYETFRRIDGFIAFLMFNISILITFTVEVFFLGKFSPTWILLLGGCIIIGSTIIAELINSHCQKKGL